MKKFYNNIEFRKCDKKGLILLPFICFVSVFLLVFLVVVSGALTILLTKFRVVINPDNVFIPEGMELFDLNYFYMRNHSIYRYDSKNIILENKGSIPVVIEEKEGETLIITTTPHIETDYSIEMEGDCECYVEEYEGDESRRVASLVYSNRYASTVVVSILGFAAAKFVNNHIDDCYENAKSALGYELDDPSSLSCAVKMVDFKELLGKVIDDLEVEKEVDLDRVRGTYECQGYCLQKSIPHSGLTYDRAAEIAMDEYQCRNHRKIKIIRVAEKDYNSFEGQLSHVSFRDPQGEQLTAILKFLKYDLEAFCFSFFIDMPNNGNKGLKVRPCLAVSNIPGYQKVLKHIRCDKIKALR